MKYARIKNSKAVDIATNPAEQFHPDLAAEFVEVPDEVDRGWVLAEDDTWSAPPPRPEPEPVRPKVSVTDFKFLWTSDERIALKELRSTDPVIDDFYDILDDTRTTSIDLALTSTQDFVNHAVQELVTAGVIASADQDSRIEQILSGQPR